MRQRNAQEEVAMDIAMCHGVDCPMKDRCLRYRAIPSQYRQTYLAEVPYDAEKKSCQHFWDHGDGWRIRDVDVIEAERIAADRTNG